MKHIIKNFESVINRLILPKFPSLIEIDIMAGTITGDESQDYNPIFVVQVEYLITHSIKFKEEIEIGRETSSLFKMIGFPENAHLRIFFSEKKDYKI